MKQQMKIIKTNYEGFLLSNDRDEGHSEKLQATRRFCHHRACSERAQKKNILKDCLLSIFLRRRVTSVTFVGPGGWNWHAEFKFLWNSFILTDTLPIFEQMIKYFLFF